MSIREELMAIKGNKEFLIVEEAHDWARSHPGSDLHKALDWNDQSAALEYRFSQIRRLIAIHITTEEGVRSMISLTVDRTRDGGGYRGLNDILSDKSLHEIMLADALRELERIQSKYESLKALAPIWRAAATVRRKRGGKSGGARATA